MTVGLQIDLPTQRCKHSPQCREGTAMRHTHRMPGHGTTVVKGHSIYVHYDGFPKGTQFPDVKCFGMLLYAHWYNPVPAHTRTYVFDAQTS